MAAVLGPNKNFIISILATVLIGSLILGPNYASASSSPVVKPQERHGNSGDSGQSLTWENDDAIIVQAAAEDVKISSPRVKRQEHLRPSERHSFQPRAPYREALEVRPLVPNAPANFFLQKYDSCISAQGETGKCVPLKQCYTAMYSFDLDNDGNYERNTELANMLREATGACSTYDPQAVRSIGTVDLVCCTGNVTELNVSGIEPVPSALIIGGKEASKGQFPYIVSIINRGKHFCGGSLIDTSHVLTAAHCVAHMSSFDVAQVTLQIGDHDIYTPGETQVQVRKVSRIIKHKRYNAKTLHNDIAILKMSTPVTLASNVKTVCLGSSSGMSSATVSGWGKLSQYAQGFPSILQFANVPILSNAQCASTYGGRAPGGIQDHMMCAGGSTDACSGDSGGPLTSAGGCQVGIVSWGIGCGTFPGVYTRVSSFSAWIKKNQLL